MRIFTILTVGATALSLTLSSGVTGAEAQGIRGNKGPAETPPASFSGRQYVDSKGCVFIRAGYGGQTTWVPRVSRSRKALCGYSPTRVTSGAASRSQATASASAAGPTGPITIVERAPQAAAPAAAAPARRAAPAVTTQPRRVTTAPTVRTQTVRAAPTVTIAPQIVTAPSTFSNGSRGSGCGASSLSARYLSGCGTAAAPKVRTIGEARANTPTSRGVIPAQTRNSVFGTPVVTQGAARRGVQIQPRTPAKSGGGCQGASALSAKYLRGATNCGSAHHSYWNSSAVSGDVVIEGPSDRVNYIVKTTQGIETPAGYREAWNDGRLNAFRGIGNASGRAQMGQVWTEGTRRGLLVIE